MKAIVGLGNPGAKYRGTRHNIGFAVVDELARRRARQLRVGAGRGADREDGGRATPEPALLAKPLTFMNASGQAVGELVRYFKIEIGRPAGRGRRGAAAARQGCGRGRAGSAGGHNGLKSIIAHLGDGFLAAAGRRRARASERGAIWPITCWRGSSRTSRRTSSA